MKKPWFDDDSTVIERAIYNYHVTVTTPDIPAPPGMP
jgi:hypothetical protein